MRVALTSGLLLLLLVAAAGSSVAAPPRVEPTSPTAQPETAQSNLGMVVADEPLAAQAGLQILRDGGNAVDAAVAVAFALAVTYPQAGNLGGGGFMLIRLHDGRSFFLDYREAAPGAARADMYLDAQGQPEPRASIDGWRAAAVPGTVAGLELALREHGTMTLKEVLAPAIRLADKGFPVGARLAEELRKDAPRLSRFPESRKIFLRNGRYFELGDTLKQKDLADTLKQIAGGGAREFYQGAIAERLEKEMQRNGGLIRSDDLRHYQPRWREPLAGRFRGYDILTAPPPSSGGIALLEMLNTLDPLLTPDAQPLDPATIHLVAETMRRAFADRAHYLGDPDFACVPVAGLLDARRAEALRASIDTAHASPSNQLRLPDLPTGPPACVETVRAPRREGEHTTHFSVVDAAGNAVSNTYTLNEWFGNAVTVPGLGFLLNDEMDDFASQPGQPNALFGLVESAANKIEPNKRPLSSMTPTIVTRDGQTVLVLGSPGGPRIINSVLLVLLNRLAFDRPLAEAVALPRYHQQWLPDALFIEDVFFTREQIQSLQDRGHTLRDISQISASKPTHIGNVNAIERDPRTGLLTGVADARRGGVVRGQ